MQKIFHVLMMCTGLLLPVSPAQAADCNQGGLKPEIVISATSSDPQFNFKMKRDELQKFRGNADIPPAAIYHITIHAMSTGHMQMMTKPTFVTKDVGKNDVCIFPQRVDVRIHINPVIYMAKELRNDACEYKEYMLHEMQHVEEDKKLVEDYKQIILRNMDFAFPEASDYTVGPVPRSLLKEAQAELSANIQGAMESTFESMMRERDERQRAIDSTGEYMRLSVACGNQAQADPSANKTGNKTKP